MPEQVQQSFPVVYSFDAHPSDDGAMLAVEATCFDKPWCASRCRLTIFNT